MDPAAGHLLDPVVADRRGGAKPFFDVTGLEDTPLAGLVAPHAGETIRLQLLLTDSSFSLRG